MCGKAVLHFILFCSILTLLSSCRARLVGGGELPLRSMGESYLPSILGPGFISKVNRSEFAPVFGANGSDFFFAVDKGERAEIYYSYVDDSGKWSEPIVILSHEEYSFRDPFLSPDESKLYFVSDLPRDSNDTIRDYDIWYSDAQESAWSKPKNAGSKINSDRNEYHISLTREEKIYFASNRAARKSKQQNYDIYSSERKDGKYQDPISLGRPVNTHHYEADVFVSSDESYIIFCSTRKGSLGRGDLYVSFKDSENKWMQPLNLGDVINTEDDEYSPFVAKRSKYFLFSRNGDIYRANIKFIEDLKEVEQ